jgi:hypothetical protein
LEALGQHDERVRTGVRRLVVLGTGDGDRREDGDPERTANLKSAVAEARHDPGLALGHVREGGDRDGGEDGADTGAEDEQPEEDVSEVAAADGHLREQERPRAQERHARRGDRPEADFKHRGLSDHHADSCRNRGYHKAGAELERRPAEHLLGVLREDERHAERDGAEAEHHEVGADKRPRAKEPQRHERRAVARLDQREGSKEPGRGGEEEDRPQAAPAGVGGFDECVDEQDERTGDGQRTGGVVAAPRQCGPALAHEYRRQCERGQADGDVNEEDPLPARAVDDRACDQVARGGAEGAVHAPDRERLVALGPLEGGRDDREGGGGHDRCPDALERSGPDQSVGRPGETAKERGEGEEQEPDHEHAAAPEQVGGAAAQQEQAGEGDRVGADHPLQPLLREAQSFVDRGQRDDHDVGVEDDHEERPAEERERPPAAGIGLCRGVCLLRVGHVCPPGRCRRPNRRPR